MDSCGEAAADFLAGGAANFVAAAGLSGLAREVNGSAVMPQHAEGTAQMIVLVGAGESEILARLVTTWDRKLGAGISFLSAAVFLCMLVAGRRDTLRAG